MSGPYRIENWHPPLGWRKVPVAPFDDVFHANNKADAHAELTGQPCRTLSADGRIVHCAGCPLEPEKAEESHEVDEE